MFTINPMSRQPVYEQLVAEIERYLLLGLLSEGQQLPSVRSLSVSLSVNPNTVQKAYTELEHRGVITSEPGRGNFVARGAIERLRARQIGRDGRLASLLRELREAGIGEQELVALIHAVYHEKEDE